MFMRQWFIKLQVLSTYKFDSMEVLPATTRNYDIYSHNVYYFRIIGEISTQHYQVIIICIV